MRLTHVGGQVILFRKGIAFSVVDEYDAGCAALLAHADDIERAAAVLPAEDTAAGIHAYFRGDLAFEIDISLAGIPAVHVETVQLIDAEDPHALAYPVAAGIRLLAEDLDLIEMIHCRRCREQELVRLHRTQGRIGLQVRHAVSEHTLHGTDPQRAVAGSIRRLVAALDAVESRHNELGVLLSVLVGIVHGEVHDVIRGGAAYVGAGAHFQDVSGCLRRSFRNGFLPG